MSGHWCMAEAEREREREVVAQDVPLCGKKWKIASYTTGNWKDHLPLYSNQ